MPPPIKVTVPARIDVDDLLDQLSRSMFEDAEYTVRIDVEIGNATLSVDSSQEAAALIKQLADTRRKANAEKRAKDAPTP